MTLSRLVAFNTLAQSVGKVISLAAGVVLTALLTRKLGVASYGGYVYIYTIVLFANALGDWGSSFIAIREASRAGTKHDKVFGMTLILKLISSLGVTAILLLITQTVAVFAEYRPIFLIAGLLIPFLALKQFFQVVFQTRLELWKLSLIDTVSSIIFFISIWLLPENLLNLRLVFAFLIFSAATAVVVGEVLVFREVKLSFKPDPKILKVLIRESAVMGLLLTVYSMYNRLDIILLERLRGAEEVGIYGLSYKIYENLVVGAAFFANSVFPVLASRTHKPKVFRRLLQKVLGSLLLGGVAVSIGAVVLAGPIVSIIAGPEFARSIAPLQILAFSLVVAYLNHATGYSLVALNRQSVSMVIAVIALVINLSLNWIFIPRFSYLAAATITLITEMFVFACSLWALTRITGRLDLKQMVADLRPGRLLKKLSR